MRIALVVLSLLIASIASAQSRNVAYFELGGNGIVPTVNYERQLTERLFGRVGLGVLFSSESDGDEDVTFVVPLMVNYLSHPAGNHHLELGGGLAFVAGDAQDWYDSDDDEQISNVVGTATLGYRFQKPVRGFVFKAGVTPVFDDSDVLPWVGVSFGYRW
jgi:hypothetical protein